MNGRALLLCLFTALPNCERRSEHESPRAPLTAPEATALPVPSPSLSEQAPPPRPALEPGADTAAPSAKSETGNEPAPEPARAPCHVALIGDSITDFRSGGGGYVRYPEGRCPGSTFSNFAKGGAMVNQMRRHFERNVTSAPAGTFTHLVLFGGVNDLYSDETAGRTPAKIERDLLAMYRAAKARGLVVVALTVAPWGGFTRYFNAHRADTTHELNAWILAQPEAGTVDVAVDAWSKLSCGDPERLCPRYAAPFHDGLHFGRAGQEILGRALYAAAFARCS